MKPNLTYTDANPEDAALLSATAFQSKKTWGYADDLMQLWKTDLEITDAYILENKVVKVYQSAMFVGFFALKVIENGTVELDHLWLTAQNMRQHFGSEIFRHITDFLSANGFLKMTLIAEPNAAGFYEKMGGKVIGKFESKVSGRFLDIYEFRII